MKELKKKFYIIWSGQAISLITSAIVQMALIFYITDVTGSAAMLSIASLCGFMPYVLFGPIIGVYVDRIDRRLIMINADGIIAIAGIFLILMSGYQQEPSYLVFIMIVLFIRSLGTAFHTPAITALTPSLIAEDELVKYAGITQSMQALSYIISPVFAAILYASIDLSLIIAIDVIGAVVAIGAITLAKLPKQELNAKEERSSVIEELKQGINAIRYYPGIGMLLLVGTLYMMVYMPINSLYPLMSMDYFQGTPIHASITEVSYAIGMLVAGSLVGYATNKFKRVTVMAGSIVLMGIALVIGGMLESNMFMVFVLCCLLMGFSVPFYSSVQTGIIQEKITSEYLGRVFALSGTLMTLAMPIGLIFSGLFADIIGVDKWFLLSGIIIVIIGVICSLLKPIRDLNN